MIAVTCALIKTARRNDVDPKAWARWRSPIADGEKLASTASARQGVVTIASSSSTHRVLGVRVMQ
jgi:hypothetical protein